MTNSSDESAPHGVGDDQLPEDLKPDENPLAEGLDSGETAGDLGPGELLEEGKTADDGGDADPATATDPADAAGGDDAEV